MSWESDLIGERTLEITTESGVDTKNDEDNKPKALDYVKMNNDELIKILKGRLNTLDVLKELKEIGENVEEAATVAFKDYQNIKRVLSNRELTSDVSSIIQNIYDELIKKFENLGIQQDNGMLIHD